jgi:outer membrane putative beta-barrel porin/alpha-amylase
VTTKRTKDTKICNFRGTSPRGEILESRGEFPLKKVFFVTFVFFVVASSSKAQVMSTKPSPAPGIQDNSFLMEEAYNQEQGIVQHISTFRKHRGSSDFDASFTQEWPIGSITHQLSYDLPLIRSARQTGIGDVRVNYRYQLEGSGETRLAVSPRLSLTLPTGDWKKGRGSGAVGIETMLPVSYVLSPLFTTHSNAGLAFTPSARNSAGERANSFALTLAQSLIVTAHPNIQFLVETVYTRDQSVIARNSTEWSDDLVISPGVRGALNFASGLQIVPGLAVPLGAGPSRGDRSLFFYLSFEHPFARTSAKN